MSEEVNYYSWVFEITEEFNKAGLGHIAEYATETFTNLNEQGNNQTENIFVPFSKNNLVSWLNLVNGYLKSTSTKTLELSLGTINESLSNDIKLSQVLILNEFNEQPIILSGDNRYNELQIIVDEIINSLQNG